MPATVPLARYAAFFAEQEEPEVAPNEVAHCMSALTGVDHFQAHQTLLSVNPRLVACEGRVLIDTADLAAVAASLHGRVSPDNA